MEMSDVKLARVTRKDVDELLHANRESREYHGCWVQPFTTAVGFEEWYSAQIIGASVGLVARDRESGHIVGVTHLSQIFYKGFQNAYLSYWGMVSFAGTGRMSQAVELTTMYAFEELGLHRIEANIQPENVRSIALVKRLGFQKEGFSPKYLQIAGVWCDHERWALLADER
ncbi:MULTISPECIES: GNAT family N-acetyltransferase [Pseudomonas]|uniref:GNAT family N-acetyltransferase n=1 Tax=Pseudomonas TaxID=286 RepID=UPI001C65CBBB|nr:MULTISPECIES: GNAT family protein [unclassified Pseudomonas]MBW8126708.1 GNAT family N-acetyltransferase [Pseudomonas sp. LAP_36]